MIIIRFSDYMNKKKSFIKRKVCQRWLKCLRKWKKNEEAPRTVPLNVSKKECIIQQ